MNNPLISLKRFAAVCGAIAIFFSLLALTGWVTHNLILTNLISNYKMMAPSTAIVCFLLGLSLLCIAIAKEIRPVLRSITIGFTGLSALLCLLILFSFFFNIDFYPEKYLFSSSATLHNFTIGRMSPVVAGALLLICVCSSLIIFRIVPNASSSETSDKWMEGNFFLNIACFSMLAILIFSFLLLVGYCYNLPFFYNGNILPPSFPTSICIFVLSAGIFAFVGIRSKIAGIFFGNNVFVRLSRSIIPFLMLVIIIDGWLDVHHIVLMSNQLFEHIFFTILEAICITAIVLYQSKKIGRQITEAEEKIIESEEKHRVIFETDSDAIMLLTEKGFFDCNPQTLAIFGIQSKEEFVKTHPADLSPPFQPDGTNSFDAAMEKIRTAFTHGKNQFEWIHQRANGDLFQAEVLLTRLTIHGKKVLQATVRDISEQKKAQEQILKFKLGIERSDGIVFMTDGTGSITYVNPAFEKIYGYSQKEVLGQTPRILESGKHSKEFYENFWETILSKQVVNTLLQNKTKDGRMIFVKVSANPIIGADGKVNGFIAIQHDITDQIIAEEKTRESEYFFRETQRVAQIGSYKTDFVKGFWESSEVLDEIFGIDKNYSRSVQGWLNIIHPLDVEMMNAYLAEEVIAKQKKFDHEYRIIRINDKKERSVHGIGEVAFDKSGNILSMIGTIQDITERKNAEKELLQLSRKDEMILNSAGEGILGIDKKGNHTFVNPAAARMFGYEIQDMIGKHSHKMWHHTKADGSVYLSNECNIYASLKDGSVHYATDEVFWRKDGTSFPAEYRSTPMVENGKIVGAVVTFNDITKRKQAEEKIAESQNRLFTFLNESPLNIYFIDPLTLKIYYANPTFFKTLGYDPGEISNISLYDFVNIPKDELDAFLSVIFSSKKTSVPISRKWKRKDGTLIDMLVNISYTRQGENEFLFITAQDTSEISRLEKQLTQSNEVLSNIFNSLEKETFWSRDLTTGKMIYVSPGVEKLVGRHVVEFMQDEKKWIDVVHPDDRDTLIAALRQTENGKSFSLDFRAVLPDESVKWIHANVISIVENGKAVRVNGSLYDMTEVKLLNEQLNEKVQDMNMFIYRASHDLRGPLASILGLSALGKTESASNEQMNFYFDKINFSISRLDMIIQELSKIGRIIQVPVKIESVDLKKEIPEIIDSLRALPNSSKIKFEILIDTPKINSDKVFLIMILQNLIANAINYSDTRKSTRMITIRAFESMGGNVLVVSDNGIGIESELQKKVFDMFYRGNESSTGTGLGLYIVKQTVQKLGGRIKLSSEKGKGTSFTIILPQ